MIEFVLRLLRSQSVDPFYESGNMHPDPPPPLWLGEYDPKLGQIELCVQRGCTGACVALAKDGEGWFSEALASGEPMEGCMCA